MDIRSITEQYNKALHDLSAIAQKEMTPENRSAFDALSKTVEEIKGDLERAQRAEEVNASIRSAQNSGRPPRSNPGAEIEGADRKENEKRAFSEWLRTGQVSAENRDFIRRAETRDLGVGPIAGPITGGGVLVPTGFDPQFHIAQKSWGALAGAVRNFNTANGAPLRVSLSDDTANGLSLISEATAVSENDPGVSGFTSNTDEMTTGLVKVSVSLIEDSAFDIDSFVRDTFAKRYYRGLSKFIQQGNGSNIASIVTGAATAVTTAAPTAITYQELLATYAGLDPAYVEQSSFTMSASTRNFLMGLTDNYGRPLLTEAGAVPFGTLFGRPIVISQYADAVAASKTPILFGDLQASYTLRNVNSGMRIVQLRERFAELNEVGYIGYTRAGGFNTSQAGSPSLVALKTHA
ncbi:MAG: phage major capsid protein [Acidobacteria bacterium]|nr:phage major capsid protein [Acidobacteriota bacterium]